MHQGTAARVANFAAKRSGWRFVGSTSERRPAPPQVEQSMSSANRSIELLAQFQEAYAVHGHHFLWLAAVTSEELGAYPFLHEILVGVVPLGQSAWYIVGEIVHASRFGAGEAYCKLGAATLDAFSKLA